MSEEKNQEELVGVIDEAAIVNIPMSTGFYKRIQTLLNHHLENRTKEEFQVAHESIREQKITEAWVFHYETLLILCNEFEKTAKANGFIKEVPVSEYQKTLEQKIKDLNLTDEFDAVATDENPSTEE